MTDQQKYLLLGIFGVAGLAYWYYNYGPGVTVAVTTTSTAATPSGAVPAPTGVNVPVPLTVSQFIAGFGPNSLASWYNLVSTLPAANIQQQYANINALVTAEQGGGSPTQEQLDMVYNWFADYGMTNFKL